VIHTTPGSGFGGSLRSKGRSFSGSFKANGSRTPGRYDVAIQVSQCDQRVVECRLNESLA
jgi:hypothetical protein